MDDDLPLGDLRGEAGPDVALAVDVAVCVPGIHEVQALRCAPAQDLDGKIAVRDAHLGNGHATGHRVEQGKPVRQQTCVLDMPGGERGLRHGPALSLPRPHGPGVKTLPHGMDQSHLLVSSGWPALPLLPLSVGLGFRF